MYSLTYFDIADKVMPSRQLAKTFGYDKELCQVGIVAEIRPCLTRQIVTVLYPDGTFSKFNNANLRYSTDY